MGLFDFLKKKKPPVGFNKNGEFEWDKVTFAITRCDDFNKVNAINAFFKVLDMGLMDGKRAVEATEKFQLPLSDPAMFWKIESALKAAGAVLDIYAGEDLVDKELLPKPEEVPPAEEPIQETDSEE